jgi:hypothetical protein
VRTSKILTSLATGGWLPGTGSDCNITDGITLHLKHGQLNSNHRKRIAALACSPPFGLLDMSQIQQIQRIKNVITLENTGEMQADVRQSPGYKAGIL